MVVKTWVEQILWYLSPFPFGGLQRWKPRCPTGLHLVIVVVYGLGFFQAIEFWSVCFSGCCLRIGGLCRVWRFCFQTSCWRWLSVGALWGCSCSSIYFTNTHEWLSSSEALSRLNVVIRDPNALQPDNVMAYDNAVSALGKICQYHRDSIDSSQVSTLISFVSWQYMVFAGGWTNIKKKMNLEFNVAFI